MAQTAIFGPVFTMLLLTFAVWVYMFIKRINFIQGNNLTPDQLSIPGELARLTPASVSNPSDNFKNLFEMPILFYTVTLLLFMVDQVDTTYVIAAWIFAIFRIFHSIVHCTINRVMLRFYLYLVSALAVWFMVGRAALNYVLGA
ncbi:MAG: MAPEG family protein [Pseudomonadota bacterium]